MIRPTEYGVLVWQAQPILVAEGIRTIKLQPMAQGAACPLKLVDIASVKEKWYLSKIIGLPPSKYSRKGRLDRPASFSFIHTYISYILYEVFTRPRMVWGSLNHTINHDFTMFRNDFKIVPK